MAAPEPAAPAADSCLNCGALLQGAFCHRCGQHAVDPIGPLRAVAADAADAFLDLDRRVLDTLRALLLHPGFLSEQYVQGRRRSWMSPFRLYLLASLGYFLLQQWTEAETTLFIQTDDPSLTRALAVWLPRLLFLVVPVFALLVGLLYRRQGRHLIEHLVFAVHVQAAWFLLLSLDAVVRWLLGLTDTPAVALVLMAVGVLANLGVPVYLWLALRRFYGSGRWSTSWRSLLLLAAYLVLLLGVLMVSLQMAANPA